MAAAPDPVTFQRANFLQIPVSDEDRAHGNPETGARLSGDDDAFDALVAMITVYGADHVAHVYSTLGDALTLPQHPQRAKPSPPDSSRKAGETPALHAALAAIMDASMRRGADFGLTRARTVLFGIGNTHH